MEKRRLRDKNIVIIKGRVKSEVLWDGDFPALLLTVAVGETLHNVKVAIEKDGLFHKHHGELPGKHMSIMAAFDSWEKDGKTNYGIKAYEKGVVANRSDEHSMTSAFVIATVAQKKAYKDGTMYQLKTGVRNPKTEAWIDKFIRMVCADPNIPQDEKVLVEGELAKDGDVMYVFAHRTTVL